MKVTETTRLSPPSEQLKLTATEMAAVLRRREVTSLELVEAHIDRITETHSAINAVVVPLFEQARAEAKQADRVLQRGNLGDEAGPLFGVPITIKEFFDVTGTKTTAGIEIPNHPDAKRDAVTVAMLRDAGAIVLGKTNVPQLGLAIESENPVYGRTSNPLDLTRSSGGSSGGEAAIIAAHGSPLGLGSDGGGSIRLPSHFCGLYGLKPTASRLSMVGHWQLPAFPSGWSVPGPIARSVEDLHLAMSVLTKNSEFADQTIAPAPFPDWKNVRIENLKIGFYDDDGFATPSPAIRRAVQEAVKRLSDCGATVVPFQPPAMTEAWEINLGLFYADGGKWMRKKLGSSARDRRVKKTLTVAGLPTLVRRALPTILDFIGQEKVASVMRLSRHKRLTAYQYQEVLMKQWAFRFAFYRRMENEGIDTIVCPPFASVAMKHAAEDIVLGYGYTYLYNMLGLPAGVMPMSVVQAGEESDRKPSRDGFVKDLIRAEEGSVGLPVGVQIAARLWREDVVLAAMKALSPRVT